MDGGLSRLTLAVLSRTLAVLSRWYLTTIVYLSNLGKLAGMLAGLVAAAGRLSPVGGWREERNHGFVWLWRVAGRTRCASISIICNDLFVVMGSEGSFRIIGINGFPYVS